MSGPKFAGKNEINPMIRYPAIRFYRIIFFFSCFVCVQRIFGNIPFSFSNQRSSGAIIKKSLKFYFIQLSALRRAQTIALCTGYRMGGGDFLATRLIHALPVWFWPVAVVWQ